MAIGAKSDPNLENLAKWSNGQTYFIHDGKSKQTHNCRSWKCQMFGLIWSREYYLPREENESCECDEILNTIKAINPFISILYASGWAKGIFHIP